ncbi:MAG: hypothetical protein PHF33_01240 [Candidatus Delongbacteria bacterium]|nr:hypothetical protein [Candidatus Delongbacteria bacterium]
MNRILKITTTLVITFASFLFSADVWSGYVNLTKDYIVGNGEALQILPGTVIRVAPGFRLIIDGGVLLARGNEFEPIRFTSYEPESTDKDYWGGIEFYNAVQDTSVIDHCIIENIIKTGDYGSVFLRNSIVKITNSEIRNNSAKFGSAVHSVDSYLYMFKNKILDNTVNFLGSAVFISHESNPELANTTILKNLIMGNKSGYIDDYDLTSGGILVFENNVIGSYTLIQENEVIANSCTAAKAAGGIGGGIQIRTQSKYSVDVIGNKIMYNKAGIGGGLAVIFKSDGTYPHNYKNNIVSNNTSVTYSGGVFFDMDYVRNPEAVAFTNNNIINNLNLDPEIGSGGYFIKFSSDLGNYIKVVNSIAWGNYMSGKSDDFNSNPSVYPGAYVSYSNTTNYIEGRGNISLPSLFYRKTAYYGADPYENYLRGDFHLSLESPCLDAGDPDMISYEPDETKVNIGAYGNTNEATTTVLTIVPYEYNLSVYVPQGRTFKLDCSENSKQINIDQLVVEDGGQIFIKTSPYSSDPNIYINQLRTNGRKIGDLYTTKIQRMTAATQEEPPVSYNIINVIDLNCSGAQFNNMALSVIAPDRESILTDSHVFIDEYNASLTGINLDTDSAYVENNIVDNFGIGIYYGPLSKGSKAALRSARITNNTISFDASASNKETKAKGIVVESSKADVENNTVINPNEGIEASYASSGRITNNTVSFDGSASNKAGTNKKAIHIFGGADYEVDHNKIYCDDELTAAISGIEVHDSGINCHYNIIRFGSYGTADHDRFGFFTQNLSAYPIFINNTVYNSDIGFADYDSAADIKLYNNIFYGPTGSTSVTGTYKNIFLYNNDMNGEINWSAVADEQYNIYDNPQFQSSKVNDFYLWGESKCIDAGRFEPAYHIYGDTFYGTAPDIGAVEFYQESSFYAPQNISCSVSGTTLTISWSAVPDAVSYNIYGSNDPYGTFTFIKDVTGTNWSASTATAKYFYRVTASRDGVKPGSGIEDDLAKELTTAGAVNRKIRIQKKESLK